MAPVKSYHDLTAEERRKVADFLDLLDAGGIFGVAVRYYRDQERTMARMMAAKLPPAETVQDEIGQGAYPW